jgi:hypothetical protein
LDADETVSPEFIAEYIKLIIELNLEVEAFWLHRVNIVDGITLKDVNNWGWNISKLENYIQTADLKDLNAEFLELLERKNLIISKGKQHNNITYYRPIINWPRDPQLRLYKNISALKWERPVHEYLTGYNTISRLPAEPALSIIHSKHINKQRNQNKYYSDIINLKL